MQWEITDLSTKLQTFSAMSFCNDKIIIRRMRGIGGGRGDDHAEFSSKTSLRICANFGRRLDARLFIPAALRFASSTSLFAHLIGRPSPHAKDSHSAEWLFIQTFPSSAILHGFVKANERSKIQTLSLFFSLSLFLSLFLHKYRF